MNRPVFYVSNGRMYLYNKGKGTEIPSGVLDSYISKVKSSAERNEWKYNGSGAAFMGGEHRLSANDAVSSVFSRIHCVSRHRDQIIYSIDIDNTNGIYRKSLDSDGEGIVLCSSSNAYRDFDIKGDLLVTTSQFAGESHIGVLNMSTNRFDLYTEGRAMDSAPVWSAVNDSQIYFCSAGLPEDQQQMPDTDRPRGISQMVDEMYSTTLKNLGPSALCLLDISSGSLDELLSDDRYDYLRPQSAPDGSVYYIRRPYKSGEGFGSSLGCLVDAVMLPVRLVGAIFGFLNVFSATYSGKTLSRSNVKKRDQGQMMIDGNLINAERELKANQRKRDKNPGIIPHSWELRRLAPDGTDTIVKAGVAAYRLMGNGELLLSNGSHILHIDAEGNEEKLISAHGVTYIK